MAFGPGLDPLHQLELKAVRDLVQAVQQQHQLRLPGNARKLVDRGMIGYVFIYEFAGRKTAFPRNKIVHMDIDRGDERKKLCVVGHAQERNGFAYAAVALNYNVAEALSVLGLYVLPDWGDIAVGFAERRNKLLILRMGEEHLVYRIRAHQAEAGVGFARFFQHRKKCAANLVAQILFRDVIPELCLLCGIAEDTLNELHQSCGIKNVIILIECEPFGKLEISSLFRSVVLYRKEIEMPFAAVRIIEFVDGMLYFVMIAFRGDLNGYMLIKIDKIDAVIILLDRVCVNKLTIKQYVKEPTIEALGKNGLVQQVTFLIDLHRINSAEKGGFDQIMQFFFGKHLFLQSICSHQKRAAPRGESFIL